MQAAARALFEHTISTVKFEAGSVNRKVKVEILAERFYRLFLYIAFTLTGLWILRQSDFLHQFLLGSESNPQYFKNYPF